MAKRMAKHTSESANVRHALRAAMNANANTKQPLIGSVLTRAAKLFSCYMLALFPPAPAQSMCKYYGHVVDSKKWGSGLPNCRDCGKEISSPTELRGSFVKGTPTTK